MMKMEKKLRILGLFMLPVVLLLLFGCDDAQVFLRYDEKTIYLYSNEEAQYILNLNVDVIDADSTITLEKCIAIDSGTTVEMHLEDFAPDFFSYDAKISNVTFNAKPNSAIQALGIIKFVGIITAIMVIMVFLIYFLLHFYVRKYPKSVK